MANKINSFIEEKNQEKSTEAPTPVEVEQFQPSIIRDEVEVIAEIAERRVEAGRNPLSFGSGFPTHLL